MRDNLIRVDNTMFIYKTNFSGDPNADSYGSKTRKGQIIIPDMDTVMLLQDHGVRVRETRPRPGEEEGFVPRYYVSIIVNYDSEVAQTHPPRVYLVNGNEEPILLNAETIGNIDHAYVSNVNAVLEVSFNRRYNKTLLYVRTMYVEQAVEIDPYADKYRRG